MGERNAFSQEEEGEQDLFLLFASSPSASSPASSSSSCAQASDDAWSAALLAGALEGMPRGPRCCSPSKAGVALAAAAFVKMGVRFAVVAAVVVAAAVGVSSSPLFLLSASKLPLLLLLSPSKLEFLNLPPAPAAPPAAAEAGNEGKAPDPPPPPIIDVAPNLADDAVDSGLEKVLLAIARCILALCKAEEAYGLIVGARKSVAESGRATDLEACKPAMDRPNATVTSLCLGGSNSR